MSDYYPDRWILLKTGDEFKIFGSWCGGYTTGDSWRMNSGIKSVSVDIQNRIDAEQDIWSDYFSPDDTLRGVYKVYGYSGSVYHCPFASYGANIYAYGELLSLIDGTDTLQLSESEALRYMKAMSYNN